MADATENEFIGLTLPIDWIKVIDCMVEKHLYGAQNRQDIIRAILSNVLVKEAK